MSEKYWTANFFDKNGTETRSLQVQAKNAHEAEEKACDMADELGWPVNFKIGDVFAPMEKKPKKTNKKVVFARIPNKDVIHCWKSEHDRKQRVEIHPDWYEKNGTPVDDCDDMKYVKTMVKQTTVTIEVRGGVAYLKNRNLPPYIRVQIVDYDNENHQ